MSGLAFYGRVWRRMASMSLQGQLAYPIGSLGFLLGKLFRLVFFLGFFGAVFRHTPTLGGYTLAEMALFFLTFNLVDMLAQILFRGVYAARRTVQDGDFDFYLVQPCSPLFRMAFTTVDFLDVVTIVPVLALTGGLFGRLPGGLDPAGLALYVLLVLNGLSIAMAIHIAVAGLAVRTQELESAIWVYRDVMFMGKFPVDIYGDVTRWALTFILPIAVMTTFPAKALLGTLEPRWLAYALGLNAVLLAAAARYWLDSIKQYTSSSS